MFKKTNHKDAIHYCTHFLQSTKSPACHSKERLVNLVRGRKCFVGLYILLVYDMPRWLKPCLYLSYPTPDFRPGTGEQLPAQLFHVIPVRPSPDCRPGSGGQLPAQLSRVIPVRPTPDCRLGTSEQLPAQLFHVIPVQPTPDCRPGSGVQLPAQLFHGARSVARQLAAHSQCSSAPLRHCRSERYNGLSKLKETVERDFRPILFFKGVKIFSISNSCAKSWPKSKMF